MSNKKQGLKKNGSSSAKLIDRIAAKRDLQDRELRIHSRIFQLDMDSITLGRMGFRKKKFAEFDRISAEVMNEYADDIITDSKQDRDMWYMKGALDRELKMYVGEEIFVEYDKRYDLKPKPPVPMTHGTDIRSMPYKDLAHFLFEWNSDMSEEEILKWLNEPYDWEKKHG